MSEFLRRIRDIASRKEDLDVATPRDPKTLVQAMRVIRELNRRILDLEDARDSLQEALDLAQAEVIRVKTETRDIQDNYRETKRDAAQALRQSNGAKDEVLVMAGTLNRAREVAGDMKEPLLSMNDAIPALPEPTNEAEEEALSEIAGSVAKLTRYAGMIATDGKGVEDLRITEALDKDRKEKGLPLLSGPMDEDTALLLRDLDGLRFPDWAIVKVAARRDPSTFMTAVQGRLKYTGPDLEQRNAVIPFSLNHFDGRDGEIKAFVVDALKNAITDYYREADA